MKIAFLGDLGFFGKMDLRKNPQLLDYFKPMHDYLQGFDLVIGNLETPIVNSECKKYGHKSAYISTNESSIDLLKYLNISAVSLANNHTYDYGRKGLEYTKKILTQNNINYFGVDGIDYLYSAGETTYAFHGYCCYSTNSYGLCPTGIGKGIHSLEYHSVKRKLEEYKEQGFVNIVCPHFGEEHVNIPNIHHIIFFRSLSAHNDFIMVGHHPHVIQGVEKYNNSILAYSLGNFCFDDVYVDIQKEPLVKLSDNNRTSMVLSMELIKGQTEYELKHFNFKESIKFLNENAVYDDACGVLSEDLTSVSEKRTVSLQEYLQGRKAKRNVSWYLKRLKPRYFTMIYRAKYNARMFHKNVISPLD